MKLIRGLHNIKSYFIGCILTIGNFDGFHRGHQLLISKLRKKKVSCNLPIVVIIFEPQPQEYFSKQVTIRLNRLRDKIQYLFAAGVDIILCIKFNEILASTEAESFVRKILIQKLKVRFIYIGEDFRFGAFRIGDYKFLKKMGEQEGFEVIRTETCLDQNGHKISSTLVKCALMEDRILDAELLMGHSYRISGKVIHGNALGRTIGFPTANMSLQGKKLPIHGVYAVEVYGIFNFPLIGVANIGVRPTINGILKQQLEVHLLNVSLNLYSYYITVVILAKIRNERCFSSIHTLRYQINNDVIKVYNYFKRKYFKKMNGVIHGY